MEEVFLAQFHGRISYTEVMNLPIWRRRWFIKRMQKEYDTMYNREKPKK